MMELRDRAIHHQGCGQCPSCLVSQPFVFLALKDLEII